MVDFFLVLMLANAGDELQGIKKGILEIADGIAINKADKKHLQQALLAKKVYETAMHIIKPTSPTGHLRYLHAVPLKILESMKFGI